MTREKQIASIKLKRVYEAASDDDGMRILVDRLWPRGLSKRRARIDQWLPDVAPSAELRRWFNHDPDKWTEFKRRYRSELRSQDEALKAIRKPASQGPVTLLFASKETRFNNAAALKEYLIRAER